MTKRFGLSETPAWKYEARKVRLITPNAKTKAVLPATPFTAGLSLPIDEASPNAVITASSPATEKRTREAALVNLETRNRTGVFTVASRRLDQLHPHQRSTRLRQTTCTPWA